MAGGTCQRRHKRSMHGGLLNRMWTCDLPQDLPRGASEPTAPAQSRMNPVKVTLWSAMSVWGIPTSAGNTRTRRSAVVHCSAIQMSRRHMGLGTNSPSSSCSSRQSSREEDLTHRRSAATRSDDRKNSRCPRQPNVRRHLKMARHNQ